ncbi:RusA family crossover junction endodeoxyribonuclease [Chloroflexota bacterium]
MAGKMMGKTGTPPSLALQDSLGSYGALGEIKTGSEYRKETIENIKRDLRNWMANDTFEPIRGKQIDMAIVIKCSPYRMKKQDTDNIAKVICDALKERKGDSRYLFDDDSQIIRLLVWKILRKENSSYDTNGYDISFRIHDSSKPMKLDSSMDWLVLRR